jgi:hypothetical protein
MVIRNRNLYVIVLAALLSASMSSAVLADSAACGATQSDSGSFFSGRTYNASEDFPNISQDVAFKRIYSFLVKEGWNIGHSDKEMGAISASEGVQAFDAKTVPLNVLVETTPTGSKVSLIFRIGMGQVAEDTPGYLCRIMSSVTSH